MLTTEFADMVEDNFFICVVLYVNFEILKQINNNHKTNFLTFDENCPQLDQVNRSSRCTTNN
jgi:hypothetical protein